MKEVAFRWVDKWLIHLNLREKFYLLFLLPLITLLFAGWVLTHQSNQSQKLDSLQQQQLVSFHTILIQVNGRFDTISICTV